MPVSLLMFAAMGGQGVLGDAARELGVAYDPANGFFEYAAAGRLLKDNLMYFEASVTGSDWANASQTAEGDRGRLAKRLANLTAIEVRREALSEFKPVLVLVESARNKRIWDPRPLTKQPDGHPPDPGLRSLASFLTTFACDYEMADGNRRAATRALADAMRAAEAAYASEGLLGAYTGYLIQKQVSDRVHLHLARLTVPDCEALLKVTEEHLAMRPFEAAWKFSIADTQRSIESVFRDPKKEDFEDSEADFSDLLAATPAERARLKTETQNLFRRKVEELGVPAVFGPKELSDYIDANPRRDLATDPRINERPIPERFLEINMVGPDLCLEIAAIREIQLRLLRATLTVARYRWHFDRFPSKLTDAGAANVVTDPVTGLPYRYRIKDQDFELIAAGPKAKGEITLSTEWKWTPPKGMAPPPGAWR